MTSMLPSPPDSRASTPASQDEPSSTTSSLTQQLDAHLERYLELLDRYTSLREELSKSLSSGFLSLAQAQRTSNLGIGRRYGQEGYDGRMKALRRVQVKEIGEQDQTASSKPREGEVSTAGSGPPISEYLSIFRYQPVQQKSSNDTTKKVRGGEDKTSNEKVAETSENSTTTAKEVKPDPSFRDPVTWFGILVPPALRQTQTSFIQATESTIPALMNAKASMEALEYDIWQIRDKLGIGEDYTGIEAGVTGNVTELTTKFAGSKVQAE